MAEDFNLERALKDEEYRKTLTPEQLSRLPQNPAGEAELSENDLDEVSGGLGDSGRRCQQTTGSCLASKRTETLKCGGC